MDGEREGEKEREGRITPEGESGCCEGLEDRSLEYESLSSIPPLRWPVDQSLQPGYP